MPAVKMKPCEDCMSLVECKKKGKCQMKKASPNNKKKPALAVILALPMKQKKK